MLSHIPHFFTSPRKLHPSWSNSLLPLHLLILLIQRIQRNFTICSAHLLNPLVFLSAQTQGRAGIQIFSNGLPAVLLAAVDEVHVKGAPPDLAVPREGHHARPLVDRPDALIADAVAVEGQPEVTGLDPGMLALHGVLRDVRVARRVILPTVLFFGLQSDQNLKLGPLLLDPACDVLADIFRISVHPCICLAGEDLEYAIIVMSVYTGTLHCNAG